MSLVVYMLSPPIPFPNFPRVFCSGWLLQSRVFLNLFERSSPSRIKIGTLHPLSQQLWSSHDCWTKTIEAARSPCQMSEGVCKHVASRYTIQYPMQYPYIYIYIYVYIHIHTLRISKALAKCIQIYPNLSNMSDTDSPRSKPGTVVDGQALGVLASCHDVEQSKTSKPRRPLHLRQTWHARIYMDLRHRTATEIANRTNMIWQ